MYDHSNWVLRLKVLKEAGREKDLRLAGEDRSPKVGRSWNELRFLAADRQKWKELTDNLCS